MGVLCCLCVSPLLHLSIIKYELDSSSRAFHVLPYTQFHSTIIHDF